MPFVGASQVSISVVRSYGDLEVVLLHETHSVLSAIIRPDIYSVGGTVPEQSVMFHNDSTFDLFLILVVEFFSEGARSALIDKKFQNLSLLTGLRWLCDRYSQETMASGLKDAVEKIEAWAAREVPFEFYCAELEIPIQFPLSRKQLISFGANTAKHHLFRLAVLFGKLEKMCKDADYNFEAQQYPAVLESMTEEVRSRMQYHSSYIIELLGNVFLTLNRLIVTRFNENPTNRVNNMVFPDGVTSDVYRNLYGDVMVSKRYNEKARILKHIPVTTRYLKMRY